MKARIEKKLSKRLIQLYPSVYRCAWVDDDFSELAYEQQSRVSHCLSVGGGTDYGVKVRTHTQYGRTGKCIGSGMARSRPFRKVISLKATRTQADSDRTQETYCNWPLTAS